MRLFVSEEAELGWENKEKIADQQFKQIHKAVETEMDYEATKSKWGADILEKRKSQRSEFGISTFCTFPLIAFKNTKLHKVAIRQAKWKSIA